MKCRGSALVSDAAWRWPCTWTHRRHRKTLAVFNPTRSLRAASNPLCVFFEVVASPLFFLKFSTESASMAEAPVVTSELTLRLLAWLPPLLPWATY